MVPAASSGSVMRPARVAVPAAVPPPPSPVPRLGPAGISAPDQTLSVLWSEDQVACSKSYSSWSVWSTMVMCMSEPLSWGMAPAGMWICWPSTLTLSAPVQVPGPHS